jgi:hypothetical protein
LQAAIVKDVDHKNALGKFRCFIINNWAPRTIRPYVELVQRCYACGNYAPRRYINKATPRPDGRKAIVRLTTRMIASRVIADSSKTFLGVGKAIGWLAQGNLNREVGNPFRSKTNRAQGKFWPTEAQTGEPCPLATRFLHGIVARSAQTMSPTLRPTARSLGPPQVSHVQAQRPSTKREDV